MFKIEKRFTFPMGHRLSKHKGRCLYIHGHNFLILLGLKSKILNANDMVMDFSDVKEMVSEYIDKLDHSLLLNNTDHKMAKILTEMGMHVNTIDHDPTAEKLAENFYKHVEFKLKNSTDLYEVNIDYVTVYENENSKATYTEE